MRKLSDLDDDFLDLDEEEDYEDSFEEEDDYYEERRSIDRRLLIPIAVTAVIGLFVIVAVVLLLGGSRKKDAALETLQAVEEPGTEQALDAAGSEDAQTRMQGIRERYPISPVQI